MWINTKTPDVNGYYLTIHIEPNTKDIFYKAFWWNGYKWKFRYKPDVIAFWDERFEYYTAAMQAEID